MDEPLSRNVVGRESLVDTLAGRIRADILSGTYPPGRYLPPERELAEEYGVTRTSLKHAFTRLSQTGLLETKHGVGTRVRDYERQGGLDLLPMLVATNAVSWTHAIFEVRTEVGALIAARAARHATEEQRRELRTLVERVRGAPDADTAQLAESEWHRELARSAGNPVYPLLMNVVLDTYLQQRNALRAPFADPHTAAERLEPVVTEVCAAIPERAGAAATDYLAETGRLMMEGLTEQGGPA